MSATTPITEQIANLAPFGRTSIRHEVDATYTVILDAAKTGRGDLKIRVHVERKNPSGRGVCRGIWEYRNITDVETARRIANGHWTELRNGKRP